MHLAPSVRSLDRLPHLERVVREVILVDQPVVSRHVACDCICHLAPVEGVDSLSGHEIQHPGVVCADLSFALPVGPTVFEPFIPRLGEPGEFSESCP